MRDYRKSASEPGFNVPCPDVLPIVNKVHLRMSLENVVKDIPLISDNSWTYGDLMVRMIQSSLLWQKFITSLRQQFMKYL